MTEPGHPCVMMTGSPFSCKGDWGAIVTDVLATQAPAGLIGMHTNMPGLVPPDAATALARNVLGPAARRRTVCLMPKAARTSS